MLICYVITNEIINLPKSSLKRNKELRPMKISQLHNLYDFVESIFSFYPQKSLYSFVFYCVDYSIVTFYIILFKFLPEEHAFRHLGKFQKKFHPQKNIDLPIFVFLAMQDMFIVIPVDLLEISNLWKKWSSYILGLLMH